MGRGLDTSMPSPRGFERIIGRGPSPRGLRAKSRSKRSRTHGSSTQANYRRGSPREVFERNDRTRPLPARSSSAVEKQADQDAWKLNTSKLSSRFSPRGLRAKSRSKRDAWFGNSTLEDPILRGPSPRGLRAKSRSKRSRRFGHSTLEDPIPRGLFPRGLRAKSRSKRDARFGNSTCTAPKGLNLNSRG
jgi:hypothetical protein